MIKTRNLKLYSFNSATHLHPHKESKGKKLTEFLLTIAIGLTSMTIKPQVESYESSKLTPGHLRENVNKSDYEIDGLYLTPVHWVNSHVT